MREERTPQEKLTDSALILSLYHLAQKRNREAVVGDRLKAMKLAFLANHAMFAHRAKGLNCTFYRWTWGPMSNDVYDAWSRLIGAGLLAEEERIAVTSLGARLAEEFVDDVLRAEENRFFFDQINGAAAEWGPKASQTILTFVYDMQVQPVGQRRAHKVRDLPLSCHLTEALDEKDASLVIDVPDSWLETLALTMSKPARESLHRAEDDAREGRIVLGNDVWSPFEPSAA